MKPTEDDMEKDVTLEKLIILLETLRNEPALYTIIPWDEVLLLIAKEIKALKDKS